MKESTIEIPFAKRLVLNRFIISLFGVETFEDISVNLRNIVYTGLSSEGLTNFHHTIIQTIPVENSIITIDDLTRYDQNIISHTNHIRGNRSEKIQWKYFQYLALLFTEVYLDLYFNQRESFLNKLNEFCNQFNDRMPAKFQSDAFTEADLRRIVFWSATGSGKTLIMHANLRQFLSVLDQNDRRNEIDRILLITPNEGLSQQHLREFELSNIPAEIYSKKTSGLFSKSMVEILEITKLDDEEGEKTVATESFGSKNLVFVDEGHRGAAGNKWYARRNELSVSGFTFEYSATIGQAVANNTKLAAEYSKSILFDYSYRYFYRDGFGKDYRILNIRDEGFSDENRSLYLTACLLAFYQQKLLFQDSSANAGKFNIENPLCVFVGSSVSKTTSNKMFADVVEILLFLANFVSADNRQKFVEQVRVAISGNTGLLNEEGVDAFSSMFPFFTEHLFTAEKAYAGMLEEIFNSSSNAKLHVGLMSNSEGEISLHLANNEPFGVINVGDARTLFNKLRRIVEKEQVSDLFSFSQNEFSSSIFHSINDKGSRTNMLIGSKKFTEGWNCWRVSTMGLMNVGRNEGAQIIQLFGRGVRLKGLNNSLKRHSELEVSGQNYNQYLGELETLNIFGIRSNYMENFKSYIEDEAGDSELGYEEIHLPVVNNLGAESLNVIRIKNDLDFVFDGNCETLKSGELEDIDIVEIDFYTQLQTKFASGVSRHTKPFEKDSGHLTENHMEFIDLNEIDFYLKERKRERKWHNLTIDKNCIREIILDHSWYKILIPSEFLSFNDYNNVKLWRKIAQVIVQKYSERFFRKKQNSWESQHREYRTLTRDDPNFIDGYSIFVPKSDTSIAEQLGKLRLEIENNNLPNFDQVFKSKSGDSAHAIFFDRHLYQPLLFSGNHELRIKQVTLNEGEKTFVLDLRNYYQNNEEYFKDKKFYLLRNLSLGRGVGFFEAGNFHPDFILWLLHKGKQFVSFVDPKGLVYQRENSKKINFYNKIKEIQNSMNNKNIILNSFIISTTPYDVVRKYIGNKSKQDFASVHVFFQQDEHYIGDMFSFMN